VILCGRVLPFATGIPDAVSAVRSRSKNRAGLRVFCRNPALFWPKLIVADD
jgi:hypothetical protein